MTDTGVAAVILAGQRAARTPLSDAAGVAADVLVPVGGRPSLVRVIEALGAAAGVRPRVCVGPERAVLATVPELGRLLEERAVSWRAPESDPASSAIAGVHGLDPPVLVTAGDHALLTPALIEQFCADALAQDADFVVGLVPFDAVRAAFPDSRRTVLKFADQPCCGSNLFLQKTARGVRAFELWRDLQQHRKRPHRIARALGLGLLCRYLLGRLPLGVALEALSVKAGCRVAVVEISDPTAAVDVDSVADWQLADRIVSGDWQQT